MIDETESRETKRPVLLPLSLDNCRLGKSSFPREWPFMLELFSAESRRNPFPLYDQIRTTSPVLHDPQSGIFMAFDYDSVKRLLSDHESFTSRGGPDWMIFNDPPRHTKLRGLVSKAFTPRSIAALEPRIRMLVTELLDAQIDRGEMDIAGDFAVQLPILVVADMLGIPRQDLQRFKRWNDAILNMSYTVVPVGPAGGAAASGAMNEFIAVTGQMAAYLGGLLEERRRAASPPDDLLTRLSSAEMDGERLTDAEILGFFQLLLLAGSETTTNLINNAILCFIENPDQLALLRDRRELLPLAIEEVLRYRSPIQWLFRHARSDVDLGGTRIPAGKMVLAMIGSANHDPRHFREPQKLDITRAPNPHLAFGIGSHFCMGAPLARLESRVALGEFLDRIEEFELATAEPWEPRKGLHVYGPNRLPIRFRRKAGSA
jgi:cytochrome P450